MSLTLFDTMRPAAIALFTSVFEIHTYGPGDVIVKEGQSGDFFYVPGTYMKISRPVLGRMRLTVLTVWRLVVGLMAAAAAAVAVPPPPPLAFTLRGPVNPRDASETALKANVLGHIAAWSLDDLITAYTNVLFRSPLETWPIWER
ncbi:hypothetical protein JL721_4872 [Aureococcus anophagefferens]|nr:hypothetical protein JL722_5234 [Aureococcus anophagefferens]KAH8070755.1 hypothetical protein JL721_4872 [Aureococcus anophagefferens]